MLDCSSPRIIGITSNSIIKSSGKSSLDEEIKRFDLYRKNGILVPELISFNRENDKAEFELIEGEEDIPNSDEKMYQRGFLEGTMARLGFYHPRFSVSFDDTIRNSNGLYLIDCDEQMQILPQRTYSAFNQFGDVSDFKRRILPSMSFKDLELDESSHPYLLGYQEGLRKTIRIDKNQPSSCEVEMLARCSGL